MNFPEYEVSQEEFQASNQHFVFGNASGPTQQQTSLPPPVIPLQNLPVNVPGFRQPIRCAQQGVPPQCPPTRPVPPAVVIGGRRRRAGPANFDGNQRRGPQPQWTVAELGILIQAKKSEEETFSATRGRERHKTADMRWAEVFAHCVSDGLQRSVNQCKKRWDKLSGDFKKIWDWQSAIPSGQLAYWEMATDEKRRRKLPLYYPHELYEQLEPWIPSQRGLNPHEHQVVDSLGEDGPDDPELSHFGEGSSASFMPETDDSIAAEEADAPTGFDPPLEPEATEPVSNGVLPSSNVTSPEEFNVRNGWGRKGKKARTEETLARMTGSFLDALGADSSVRNLHDEEFIGIEKERLQLEGQSASLQQKSQASFETELPLESSLQEQQMDELSWSYDEAEDGDSEVEEDRCYEQMMRDNWEEDQLDDTDWDEEEKSESVKEMEVWVADRKEWANLLGTYYLGVALHHVVFRKFFAHNPGLEVGFLTQFAEATMSVWMNPRTKLSSYNKL